MGGPVFQADFSEGGTTALCWSHCPCATLRFYVRPPLCLYAPATRTARKLRRRVLGPVDSVTKHAGREDGARQDTGLGAATQVEHPAS